LANLLEADGSVVVVEGDVDLLVLLPEHVRAALLEIRLHAWGTML
jgi:hypothetical protein